MKDVEIKSKEELEAHLQKFTFIYYEGEKLITCLNFKSDGTVIGSNSRYYEDV